MRHQPPLEFGRPRPKPASGGLGRRLRGRVSLARIRPSVVALLCTGVRLRGNARQRLRRPGEWEMGAGGDSPPWAGCLPLAPCSRRLTLGKSRLIGEVRISFRAIETPANRPKPLMRQQPKPIGRLDLEPSCGSYPAWPGPLARRGRLLRQPERNDRITVALARICPLGQSPRCAPRARGRGLA